MAALGINLGYVLIQIASFTILFLALKGWLYQPILDTLEARKERIQKGLEDARAAEEARAKADEEKKKILDAARNEAAKVRGEATGQAQEQANAIVSKANEDAKAIIEKARGEAKEERSAILAETRDQITSVAVAAAEKILQATLSESRRDSLVAKAKSLPGGEAKVTSAKELSKDEKKALESGLGKKVSYDVDESLLGGLIIRVDDQVVDGSVRSEMDELITKLS
ncbi:MAG TPA: F0F1 ATP synthase subunit B [Anaerolineae bacterium]|nr:F0F1 ATP synthase subunit B [Anaerolineae bacterium]